MLHHVLVNIPSADVLSAPLYGRVLQHRRGVLSAEIFALPVTLDQVLVTVHFIIVYACNVLCDVLYQVPVCGSLYDVPTAPLYVGSYSTDGEIFSQCFYIVCRT